MKKIALLFFVLFAMTGIGTYAQTDREEIRSGNKLFRKGNYRAAAVEYMRALDKDSTSFAASYDIASAHYKTGSYDSAAESLTRIKDAAQESDYAADYYFNLGDVAIAQKKWQDAVDAFRECLLRDPGNIEAKENYIYAKQHLEDNQGEGGGGNSGDSQDNQDQNDQNQEDQQQNQEGQDSEGDQKSPEQQEQPANVSPQQAQQMLQAIRAKEKKTQEKVEKAKAAVGVKKNEKNW